jgi:hypothetical protein
MPGITAQQPLFVGKGSGKKENCAYLATEYGKGNRIVTGRKALSALEFGVAANKVCSASNGRFMHMDDSDFPLPVAIKGSQIQLYDMNWSQVDGGLCVSKYDKHRVNAIYPAQVMVCMARDYPNDVNEIKYDFEPSADDYHTLVMNAILETDRYAKMTGNISQVMESLERGFTITGNREPGWYDDHCNRANLDTTFRYYTSGGLRKAVEGISQIYEDCLEDANMLKQFLEDTFDGLERKKSSAGPFHPDLNKEEVRDQMIARAAFVSCAVLEEDPELPDFAMAALLKAKHETRPIEKVLGLLSTGNKSKQRTYEALDGGVNLAFQAFIQPFLHAIHSGGDVLKPNTVGFNFDTKGGAAVLRAWMGMELDEFSVASIDMGDDSVIRIKDNFLEMDRNSSEFQIIAEDIDVLSEIMITTFEGWGISEKYLLFVSLWLCLCKNRVLVIGKNKYFESGRLPSGILGTTELTELCIKLSVFGAIEMPLEIKEVEHEGFTFSILTQENGAFDERVPFSIDLFTDIANAQNSPDYGYSWKTLTTFDLDQWEDVSFLSRKLYHVVFDDEIVPLFNLELHRVLAIGVCSEMSVSGDTGGVKNLMSTLAMLFWLAPWPYLYNLYASMAAMEYASMQAEAKQLLREMVQDDDFGQLNEFFRFILEGEKRPCNWNECIMLRTRKEELVAQPSRAVEDKAGSSSSWAPPSASTTSTAIVSLKDQKSNLRLRRPKGKEAAKAKFPPPTFPKRPSSVSERGPIGKASGKGSGSASNSAVPRSIAGAKKPALKQAASKSSPKRAKQSLGRNKAGIALAVPRTSDVEAVSDVRKKLELEAEIEIADAVAEERKAKEERNEAGREAMKQQEKERKKHAEGIAKAMLAAKGKKKSKKPTLEHEQAVEFTLSKVFNSDEVPTPSDFIRANLAELKAEYKVPKEAVAWIKEALQIATNLRANMEEDDSSDELDLTDLDE